jgi:hypothetical protein
MLVQVYEIQGKATRENAVTPLTYSAYLSLKQLLYTVLLCTSDDGDGTQGTIAATSKTTCIRQCATSYAAVHRLEYHTILCFQTRLVKSEIFEMVFRKKSIEKDTPRKKKMCSIIFLKSKSVMGLIYCIYISICV